MVTTGARSSPKTTATAPPEVSYWAKFHRGDFDKGPTYTGTYGFDWVDWARSSANNPATDYDDLTTVTGTPISDYVQCYDPGIPGTAAQPATASLPAIPAKPGVAPHYAAVRTDRKRYETELHKGYTPLTLPLLKMPDATAKSDDYYVPILSLRPRQIVQLKLEIEFLNTELVKPTNYFTVASNAAYLVTISGQTNNGPNLIQRTPVDTLVLDVTIESLQPSAAIALLVKNEKGDLVGQLDIADNTLVYELPLRIVYVVEGRPLNKKDKTDLTPRRPLYALPGALSTLQGQFQALSSQGVDVPIFLDQHSLNQALITCTFETPAKPHQLPMDLAQWRKDGYYSSANNILLRSAELGSYCTSWMVAIQGKAFAAFRGLTLYVFGLNIPPDPATGGAINATSTPQPVAADTLCFYLSTLTEGKASTIAHELGHALGLTHSFPMPAGVEDKDIQELIGQKDGPNIVLPTAITALSAATAAAAKPPTPAEQIDLKNKQDHVRFMQLNLQKIDAELAVFKSNTFKFTKQSTHNIMDYDALDKRVFYWHWQWALLQADVASYYGTTSPAR